VNPGAYNLTLTENSTNVLSFSISGIATASGYSAAIDIRKGDTPTSDLVLALTSSPVAGLALSSNGSSLTITVTITETQVDTIAATLSETRLYWSLKVTAPDTTTRQYLKGPVSLTRTPTA
jgi:hypothetical protein